MEARLARLEANQLALAKALAANTQVTDEIREILQAGKTGLKVLGGIGVAAKWFASIAAAVGAAYAGIHWFNSH